MPSIIFYSKKDKGWFLYGESHDHIIVDWDCPYSRYHLEKLTEDTDYQNMYDKAMAFLDKKCVPYLIERMNNITR